MSAIPGTFKYQQFHTAAALSYCRSPFKYIDK